METVPGWLEPVDLRYETTAAYKALDATKGGLRYLQPWIRSVFMAQLREDKEIFDEALIEQMWQDLIPF